MRLGTSTNLVYIRPGGTRFPLERTLEMVSQAGFTSFDLNGYDWALPGSPFLDDDRWERWIDGVANKAGELGVTFDQCHAYFYNFLDPAMTQEERFRHQTLQRRSLICCERLGASVAVLHPETDYRGVETIRDSMRCNQEYFSRLLDSTTLSLAVENMCDYSIRPRRKFCAYPEELVEFVDSFKDKRIGICWDFEHGDIMEQDQISALRYIGRRLMATHVSDTYSKTDNTLMHVLPMTGGIKWEDIVPVLREIGYDGIFCFEVHNYANVLPDAVLETALKLAWQIGDYLVNL